MLANKDKSIVWFLCEISGVTEARPTWNKVLVEEAFIVFDDMYDVTLMLADEIGLLIC